MFFGQAPRPGSFIFHRFYMFPRDLHPCVLLPKVIAYGPINLSVFMLYMVQHRRNSVFILPYKYSYALFLVVSSTNLQKIGPAKTCRNRYKTSLWRRSEKTKDKSDFGLTGNRLKTLRESLFLSALLDITENYIFRATSTGPRKESQRDP